ncbi:MAG: substrate-binding domain-containing protein [Colwellia sp.]
MTTIKDIARVANVSVATVSRVINNGPKVGSKTRLKVQLIMKEMGYTPNANARALVTKTSTTIGVVIPDVSDPFFAALAHGVNNIAQKSNMQLLISTTSVDAQSEKQAIQLLKERQCRSIILHSKKMTDEELSLLCDSTPGLILINRYLKQYAHRCIWLDNEEGGKIAARHLVSFNHSAIACISSQYEIEDPMLRLKGFVDELSSKQLTIENDLIVYREPNQLGGEEAAQQLISSGKRFTAIFAYNDAMAIGAISTLEDNGFRVPRDVSIIGFDDVLLSQYSRPKLTTLCYPIAKMAEDATTLSINLLASKSVVQKENRYLPRLIRRESTLEC